MQKSPTYALRQHDSLFMVAYDQSWVADAIVSEADENGAALAGVRIVSTPQPARILFRDSNYAIDWDGRGYFVSRIRDGARMSETVSSIQLAEKDLRSCYPKR